MNARLSDSVVLLAAGLLIFAGALPASADFSMEVISEPKGGGSWIVGLGLPSDISYDLVGTRITTGEPYGEPAFLDFKVGGWSEILNDPVRVIAAASGPYNDNVGFTLHFSGDFADPVHFDVVAYSGETLLGCMHGYWPGDGPAAAVLVISPGDWDPGGPGVFQIPAPGAVLLGAIGLGLIVVVKRKL